MNNYNQVRIDVSDTRLDGLNSPLFLYNKALELLERLGIKEKDKPHLIPYYYGVDKYDEGISLFVILEGPGYLTLHSFSNRRCIFIDIFTYNKLPNNIKTNVEDVFESTKTFIFDKNFVEEPKSDRDFGPHYTFYGTSELSFEKIYDVLDLLPPSINMHKIMMPYVVKNGNIITGIVLIAESHISIYFNTKTKETIIDMFSCVFMDQTIIFNAIKKIIDIKEYHYVTRYSKHQLSAY